MKNVTISMDDELARQTRIAAAKAGISVSRFMAQAAREKLEAGEAAGDTGLRKSHLEALERFLAGPKLRISTDGRMPSAEERNSRG